MDQGNTSDKIELCNCQNTKNFKKAAGSWIYKDGELNYSIIVF